MRFRDENLVELAGLCDEDTVRQAVLLSKLLLTEKSLEELYGNVSDDIIIQIAEEKNLRLPEDLREEQGEDEEATEQQDLEYEIQSAIDAADYALDCLVQAQRSMNDSSNLPQEKKVFLICTHGGSAAFRSIETILEGKHADLIGKFSCKGYDTYGPFKLVGGIAKGHPDEKDLMAAVDFYKGITK